MTKLVYRFVVFPFVALAVEIAFAISCAFRPISSLVAHFRWYLLAGIASRRLRWGAISSATNYARELLAQASSFPDDWNYGNAIHKGNILLGLIALKNRQITEAKEYLLKAGSTPGSPQLDTFGPNMALAKELLLAGETETVLKYFELCSKFWDADFGQLSHWTSAIRRGQVPNFGANLIY